MGYGKGEIVVDAVCVCACVHTSVCEYMYL